ncbi:cobyric acid synthase [Metabacillus sediminilitoris]|uniref:Cobyric acid synthase n=1 Tax=Metabacillus sediminilitoris TaxID=2567941 RepID=A0A4V3WF35_9BACI|nr:cobyric acid synthase [Metabacillus sediminilitoris]QGQ45046.1 cobyric acid synthase [Metabacillus sediminilitoris]THF78679.1 cobyric acid synthase [Metabacillus sediminilitoris]
MGKALPIMFQGTHSDAGKSVIVTAFCRIFAQDGYKTAPFKSQNMALNSYITIDGKEIGRAQGVQAEAAFIQATTDMNPILIKPNREYESQIVVHGKPYKNMEAGEYRKTFFSTGLKLIEESLTHLSHTFDRIVIEGAGSPAEINLNDRELVNMRVARMANAPVVLIGDIEKGGVFASLVGTLQLLEPEDHDRIIGVIINKFRGDVRLLEPGLKWFEEYTGKRVLGVIPYLPHLNIDAEDSVILSQYTSALNHEKEIDIAVIQYPKISNFTDVDPFFQEQDCHVRFITREEQLKQPDLVILPGSKNTLEDLQFLRESGIAQRLLDLYQKKRCYIFGICGGYQMLGSEIHDPDAVESPHRFMNALGLFPLTTTMTKEKTTMLSEGELVFNQKSFRVKGYEIHMGETNNKGDHEPFIQSSDRIDGCKTSNDQVIGTYFHGIFHNDSFRTEYLNTIRKRKGLPPIEDRISFNRLREEAFDRLAVHVRKHVDMDVIQQEMENFHQRSLPL